MTVPPLPDTLDADDLVDDDWVDDVVAMLGFLRDTAPVFRGRLWLPDLPSTSGENNVPISTLTTFGFGDAATFNYTPTVNIGGWTVAADTGGGGGLLASEIPEPLVVPETGIYSIKNWTRWEANSTGYRQTEVMVNGSAVEGLLARVNAPATGVGVTYVGDVIDLTAGDEIDVRVFQNGATELELTMYLSLVWERSS